MNLWKPWWAGQGLLYPDKFISDTQWLLECLAPRGAQRTFVEGTIEYSWPATPGVCKYSLNISVFVFVFFFWCYAWKALDQLLSNVSIYKNHLEVSFQHSLLDPTPWSFWFKRSGVGSEKSRFSHTKVMLHCWCMDHISRTMQPIKWWKSNFTLEVKEVLISANWKKYDLHLFNTLGAVTVSCLSFHYRCKKTSVFALSVHLSDCGSQ